MLDLLVQVDGIFPEVGIRLAERICKQNEVIETNPSVEVHIETGVEGAVGPGGPEVPGQMRQSLRTQRGRRR